MATWGPIASTPYPGESGGVPADIADDPSGGLDDPNCVLPESAVQLIEPDGTHVAWLPHAVSWGFRRDRSAAGSGSVSVLRSDPLADELRWPRQLRFFDRGVARQRARIEPQGGVTISPQEEAGELIDVGGKGALSVLADTIVEPIDLTLLPVQDAVRFSFAHPDYDDSDWDSAVDVGPNARPNDWPGGGTLIWGPSGDNEFAPGGTVYLRGPSFNVSAQTTVSIYWRVDNVGRLYLDGAEISALPNFDSNNYLRTHEVRVTLSPGDHWLAISAFNQGPDEPPGNPGSVRAVVRALDGNGQLGTILHSTSTSWKAYEYLSNLPPGVERPGWTAGQIVNWLLDKRTDRDGSPIAVTFDGVKDSDGQDWPIIEQFTVQAGQNLLDVIEQLAESDVDVDMSPWDDTLSMWVKDGQGTVRSVQLADGYSDPVDGCLVQLQHRVEPPLCSRVLLRWRDGWVRVQDDDQINAGVVVEREMQVPLLASATAAQRIGTKLVGLFGHERVQATARVQPRGDGQRPGAAFDVADTILMPDRTLELVPQVVQSWSHTVDDTGTIGWQVEAGDLVLDLEERVQSWIRRMGSGAFGGRSNQPMPYRAELLPGAEPRVRQPIVFDHDADAADAESKPWTVDDFGTIQAITVDIPGGEGGEFEVRLNGSGIETLNVSSSVTSETLSQLGYKVIPGDVLTVYSTEAIDFVVTVRIS